MTFCRALPLVAFVVVGSATVLGQDPVKVAAGTYKVVLENPSVRILRVSVPAGGKTAMHSHPENMVIPLSDGKIQFTAPDGKTQEVVLASETALYAPAETHAGSNTSGAPLDALVIEFKGAKPGTATVPTSRDNMNIKVLAEGARAVAIRGTAGPAFSEAAGTTHEYDQVVIALGPSQMSLSIDGKPAGTTWARGDVRFIPRGTPHESKNTGSKPADFIIVGIR